jgi:hypothetical protein
MARYIRSVKTSNLIELLGREVLLDTEDGDIRGRLIFGSSKADNEGVYDIEVGERGCVAGLTGWHVVDGDVAHRFYKNSIDDALDVDVLTESISINGEVPYSSKYIGDLRLW